MTDDEAAHTVAADGIDILVDVNGHTRDAKPGLFVRRPAPILVNWLGYPGTMGSPYHHYIVADDWIIPPDSEMYYSEKVVRLPCYQPNDRKRQVAPPPTRAELGLPDDAFVFCCFNGTHKISRFTFERWVEILKRVPDSVLWLLDTSAETKARLGDFAEQRGVSRDRFVFAPKMANPQHLARYPLADLFLDTVPYGAHTTASDALWMGVPVLTLSGRSFASRVCGSLVRSAGLPDFVVTDPKAYVERAIAFATNEAELETARRKLRTGRDTCQLFDTNLLVARLEDLYLEMCREYQEGRIPRPDLKNLDAYLEVGAGIDHDQQEILSVADYHGLYKAGLATHHRAWPIEADRRIWTPSDIAAVEQSAPAAPAAEPKKKSAERAPRPAAAKKRSASR
jgi:predicted O-linked N-acetylglucosamine transferase (SPINDLY family)